MYKVDQELWDGELSLSACPGVMSRPPRTKKNCKSRGYACGGMVTGQIEPTIKYEVILGLQSREKAALLKVKIIYIFLKEFT